MMSLSVPKKWQVFVLVGVSIFMSTLDSSIVNVALPYIMEDLSTNISMVRWVVVVYLLTVSSSLLTFGRLSDIRGRRPVYVGGFAVFTAGSLLCATASSPWFLITARGIQGIGASMLMACSPALITDVFDRKERGRALGMVGAVVAAGLTLGPLAGGLILEYFSWRLIFYINIPIGIIAVLAGLLVLRGVPGSRGNGEPLDKGGCILMTVMLSCLVVGLTRSSDWGVLSFNTIACLLAGVLATLGFMIHEKNNAHPLFDPALLKIRLFALPLLATGILFASLFVVVFMMPFFLTYPCGFSASRTGSIMIVPFLFLLVISPVSGALYDRLGSRGLCTAGMGFMCLSLFSLGFAEPDAGVAAIVWRIALAGIGTALFTSPNNTAVMGAVPVWQRGIASAAVATSRNLGMVSGVALAGAVFAASVTLRGKGLDHYTPAMAPVFMQGFRRAMAAGTILAAAGIPVAFLRGKEPGEPKHDTPPEGINPTE